ncbi:MAG: methyltransferase [Thalassobius sp.]|nr:methyltransferase [Thalassovita sp.]
MNSITNRKVITTLNSLHKKAEENYQHRIKLRETNPESFEAKSTAYMAISKEVGEYLYFLAKASKSKNLVEFGCSFGISTIYLASAAADENGKVITSELEPNKVIAAQQNIEEAGLSKYVSILEGNAVETLKSVSYPVDFVFLDGAKELYLPVFSVLKSKLKTGSVICADNADHTGAKPFVDFILNSKAEYASSLLFDGRLLVSCLV